MARLACAADTIGFRHQVKSVQHLPPQVAVSRAEMDAFAQSPRIKPGEKPSEAQRATMRKLIGMFEAPGRPSQRKVLTAHLFEKAGEWHFIYFDARDAYEYAQGHGKIGKHIHYGSHLFHAGLDAEQVWAALDERDVRLPTVHIRLRKGIG